MAPPTMSLHASHEDTAGTDSPRSPAPSQVVARPLPADVRLTMAMLQHAVNTITHDLFSLAYEWEDPRMQRMYSYADYKVPIKSDWPLLPRHVDSLPKREAFSSDKIGTVVGRAHSFIRSQMPFLVRLSREPQRMFADVGYDAFRAFFDSPDLFPMPAMLQGDDVAYWANDECFADQFLNGCNPTVIERVSSMTYVNSTMPQELRELSDPSGRSVSDLVEQGALLVADYAVLASRGLYERMDEETGSFVNSINFDAIGDSTEMHKHFYAPYVAFYKTESGKLGIFGIVLTRLTDRHNEVYNASTCADRPNIYTFAKMHVACADNQLHQFYSHLGRCHLVFEPFGVAVRNVFQNGNEHAQQHVVGRLLAPHFRDHMAINWLARKTLIAAGEDAIPFTDASFALGSNGGSALLMHKYKTWQFSKQTFPEQLRARGFDPDAEDDGLQYFYRDDGLRVWRAVHRYVRAALDDYYGGDDAAVASDAVLDAWCAEMTARDRAAVRSFPARFGSVAALADAVATIMYNVSAEHSAVNFSQEQYLRYVPNRPNALFRAVPAPGAERDMDLVREVLAIKRGSGDDNDVGASMPIAFAFFQVSFAHILTTRPTKTLMDLDVDGVPGGVKDQFKKELTEIHERIAGRNAVMAREEPHRAPYEFLDPMQIAQSIEI